MKMSLIYQTTKQFKIIVFFLLSFLCSEYIMAQVHVQGYYRKDGTYVKSHYRSSPDSSPYNNYSYPGNTNPYTGKVATGNTDTYLKNYSNNSSNYYSTYSNPTTSYRKPTSTYNNTITYPSYNTNTYSTGSNNSYKPRTTKRSTYSTKNSYNSIFN